MTNYFIRKYAMTEKGAENLKKAIFSRTILNLTKLFPPIIAFIFIFQYLGDMKNEELFIYLTPMQYILIILGMFIVMFIVARWDYTRLYTNVYNESANSRIDIANRLKKLPLSYFSKRDVSDLATTMMGDMSLYEEIFSHAVPHIYATSISTLIISALILNYNWKLGIATLWVIPIALLIFVISKKKRKSVNDKFIKYNREMLDDLQEKIEQVQEIKSYNIEEKIEKEFFDKVDKNSKIKAMIEIVTGVAIAFSGSFLKMGIVTVAIVGANMFLKAEINILVYIAFLIMAASIYLPIENFLAFMGMIDMMESVVSRIKEIKTMPIQEGRNKMNPKNYDIEFKNVYFGYDDQMVIKGVSFTAKQGEVTALIGPSGSGKSTLAKLAARFWDLNKGEIFLGGENIGGIDPDVLLENYSIVFQDVILFNASIKDNIKIGKKDASDDEIIRAAKLARCYEFIDKMPDGIDTLIGENGQKLSGGERQRISIARAILKDAPIILMDEATASLDVENESLIQEALSELIKDKTVIAIAHRLRTIRNADKIVLLKEGKIEAIGDDEQLCKKSKYYKDMLIKSNVG